MKLAIKAAIFAFACAALAAQAQDRVIRIGVAMPISGPGSYFGVMGKEGIDLALEQFKGGVNGYRLQVQYEDSACSPLQATNAVKRILSGYKYVFRIFPNAEQQGPPLARNAYDKLKARNAVLLYEKTNAGQDSADGFEKFFVAAGGKIVARIDFGRDLNDFTSIATRIASLGKVDVLPTFALEGQTVRLAQALAQAKVIRGGGGNAIQMGSIWLPYGFDQKAGQAAEGYIRIVQFDPTEKRAIVQDFIKAFRAKYGADRVPTHINSHAYDSILLIAEAVRRGATDSESIRERFSRFKDVEVTTGRITFGPNGQNSDLSVIHFVETQKDLSWKGLDW